ncbi:hypothetical protein [Tepidibacillus marianensis]|uniref:hypothetical protein n=1 Tax=Tepidibacillus marianensis TaxID=3131995 RepID=UPI0030CAE428
MKKKVISGILATALVLGGGTMAYVSYAQSDSPLQTNPTQSIQRNVTDQIVPQPMNYVEAPKQEVQQQPVQKVEEQKLVVKTTIPTADEAKKIMEQRGINVEQAQKFMEQQGIDINEMYKLMNSGASFDQMADFMNKQNIDYSKMQEYMNQVNPNGQAGPQGNNFQGMRNFR